MRTVRRLLTCVAAALAVSALFTDVRAEASAFVFSYQGGPYFTNGFTVTTAVAADGPGRALVGGRYTYAEGTGSFVIRSNGQSWGSGATLDGGGIDSTVTLTAVAHIGPNDDWASGDYMDASGVYYASFYHYDGTQWHSVSPPRGWGAASSISGSGANDVWAANGYAAALHWDGTAWTTYPLSTSVRAILDLSPTNVWAVGHGIVHWNGTSWSAAAVTRHTFEAVSARSAFGVWAVGDAVYQYNGSRWRAMPTPAGLTGNELRSVSFLRGADIWTTDGATLYHWGGNSWTARRVDSLVPGASGLTLTALSGRPKTGELWAIGRGAGPFLLHRAPIYG